jgi:hypothetical protein
MDEAATASGAALADPTILEHEYQGFRFGIMADGRNWMAAKEARPDLTIFTLAEIGAALSAMRLDHPLVRAAKEIGGAEIDSIGQKLPKGFIASGGDDIPFGEFVQ